MSNHRFLTINSLSRQPHSGAVDSLSFVHGVNVIVGPPNSGKTRWLQMLDYMLGSDRDPKNAFGEVMASKYSSIEANITVGGEEWRIRREWNSGTPKNRVYLNDEHLNVQQFRLKLLETLEIPLIHYPQGNPYGQRAWPELGWRSLYRHMYRRQRLWGDIADKQPESERHACVLQFLGVAKKLFSKEYGELVDAEKQVMELQAQKDQFLKILSEVTKEILSHQAIDVAITPQSLNATAERISAEIGDLNERREEILRSFEDTVESPEQNERNASGQIEKLSSELAEANLNVEKLLEESGRLNSRLSEIRTYRASIEQEIERLKRAEKAGHLLVDLKVTHCPACDQVVRHKPSKDSCFLCHQPIGEEIVESSDQRLEMEILQAQASLGEAKELESLFQSDIRNIESQISQNNEKIRENSELLRPAQSKILKLLPPEITVLDRGIGRLQERAAQIERIKGSLELREQISEEVKLIAGEVTRLEHVVSIQGSEIDFDSLSQKIEDSMNSYLNYINSASPNSWGQKPVRVRMSEKTTRFFVGENRNWAIQLGGTLTLYFLLSYHYSLMTLIEDPEFNFPGLLALDFPAELPDGTSIKDTENFVLEPFVNLLSKSKFAGGQVIVAGNSFESLEGANRIEFTKVWS